MDAATRAAASRPETMSLPRRELLRMLTTGLCLPAAGCAVFRSGWMGLSADAEDTSAPALPPLRRSPSAVVLDVVFVERPTGDPLLGSGLWDSVDESGAVDFAARSRLNRNGFRIGVAGSSPPRALQSLLGLTSQIGESTGGDPTRPQLVGRKVALLSGSETEVVTRPAVPACELKIHHEDDDRKRRFENARFLFRIRAERLQDGWVSLHFVPEIHHGQQQLRHMATRSGWKYRNGQKISPVYSQRFDVTLNLGEMAIVTVTRDAGDDSLGRNFFVGSDDTASVERVLVVRLAELGRTEQVGDNSKST